MHNIAKVTQHVLADDGRFPNSVLPLIVYHDTMIDERVTPEVFEQMFETNGWPAQWRDTVFDYHHYHSTAHEALAVAAGTASLMFGGPEGRQLDVAAGDVVVIPAGVAHKLENASEDFLVVGAYPPGQKWDTLRGEDVERPDADDRIAKVPLPQTDPVAGQSGPLLRAWS